MYYMIPSLTNSTNKSKRNNKSKTRSRNNKSKTRSRNNNKSKTRSRSNNRKEFRITSTEFKQAMQTVTDQCYEYNQVNGGILKLTAKDVPMKTLVSYYLLPNDIDKFKADMIKYPEYGYLYVYGYDKKKYIYVLFGICNHSGVSDGGHYTAIIKNANGKWYDFNDTMINEITEPNIITSHSYCFFYRKKKIN